MTYRINAHVRPYFKTIEWLLLYHLIYEVERNILMVQGYRRKKMQKINTDAAVNHFLSHACRKNVDRAYGPKKHCGFAYSRIESLKDRKNKWNSIQKWKMGVELSDENRTKRSLSSSHIPVVCPGTILISYMNILE